MDFHAMPWSTLFILLVSLFISIFYSRYNARDVKMRYMMTVMKEKMAEMKKYQKRFKETQDERYYKKLIAMQKEIMELQRKTFSYQLKRMAMTFVVFFTIYYALLYYFGREPVALAPFRMPHDIRSTPIEFSGRIISGLSFIGWYFVSSIALGLFFTILFDKLNRRNALKGLKLLFKGRFYFRLNHSFNSVVGPLDGNNQGTWHISTENLRISSV